MMQQKHTGISLLIVIISLLILILLGGIGTYFYMQQESPQQVIPLSEKEIHTPPIRTLEKGKDEETISKIGPLYPLEPFTINLLSENGNVYLKIKLNFELSIKELKNELDSKNAVIRDAVIRILSSKTYEELSNDEGKEKTLDEIATDINKMLTDGYIKNVYITEFVIQ